MTMMLIEWVLTSIFLILVVLGLRAALGKRISARLRYALWAVVLVRLLVPVQLFTSPIAGTWVTTEKRTVESVYTPVRQNEGTLPQPDGPTAVLDTSPSEGEPVLTVPDAPTLPDAPHAPEPPDLKNPPVWLTSLSWIWLGGAAAAALVMLWSNGSFARRLRRCRTRLEGADCPLPVYVAVGLPSPCLFGVARPAIYVTPETAADPAMLRHVLAHEYTHFRQVDHIWSLLRCAALAVHWWNPLVWLAVALSRRDGELACDEGAIKRLGDGERAAYGSTLLALVTAKPRPGDLLCFATTMAGDKKSLKERITRIAAAPKRWLWAAVAVVLATALACMCAFGQKAEEDTGDDPDPAPTQSDAPEAEDGETDVEVELTFDQTALDVPADVLERAQLWVASEYAWDAPGGVMTGVWKEYNEETDEWETHGDPDTRAYFDGARISAMGGPQPYTVRGVDYELWSITYEYHTTTPEVVQWDKFLHMGPGRYLDEDGWMGMYYKDSTYLIFRQNDHGMPTYAGVIQSLGEDGNPAFPSEEQVEEALYPEPERGDPPEGAFDQHRTEMFFNTDLNRNGVEETIVRADMDDGEGGVMGQYIGVFEDDQLIWWDEGYYAHAGYNAIFACKLDGQDYLLRYNPVTYQGSASYSYKLFTLENGVETVAEKAAVDFDIHVDSPMFAGPFNPDDIWTFVAKVNHLLSSSQVLMMTDEYLLDNMIDGEQPGLVENLWWLDDWAPVFVRDENKTLLGNLYGYLAAMKPYNMPTVQTMYEGESYQLQLSYHGQQVLFDGYWDQWFDPNPICQLADLNGDGKDEIVAILNEGHGTGTCIDKLYVFDADTLKQYDTAALTDDIIAQIECTGDGDNFYLEAPGMERMTIPRYLFGDVPWLADEIGLGNIVCYNLGDNGKLTCTLGCDASGTTNLYCGSLHVDVKFDGGELRVAGCSYGSNYETLPALVLRAALEGAEQITLVQNGNVTQTRKYLAGFAAPTEFAVVEMAEVGPVVVLKDVQANGAEGYLFLYVRGGEVLGTEPLYNGSPSSNGCRVDLKTDGTLLLSDGPGRDAEVWAVDVEGYFRLDAIHNNVEVMADPTVEYTVDGGPADEAAYLAAVEQAKAKQDAVWYDFIQENINAVFG